AHLHRSDCPLCRRAWLRRHRHQRRDRGLLGRDDARCSRHQHSELCQLDCLRKGNRRVDCRALAATRAGIEGRMKIRLPGVQIIELGVALEWAININLRKVRMSDTSQIALIRKLYDARGNVNSFKSLLADDAEYDIAEGFPNGGVYRGIDTVVSDF